MALEFTEEGTVAAAVTATSMCPSFAPPPPLIMKFDRPFVRIVFHVNTGTPLFVSKIDDPEFI